MKAESKLIATSLALMFAATFLYVGSTPFLALKVEADNWLAFLLGGAFVTVGIIGLMSMLKKNLFD